MHPFMYNQRYRPVYSPEVDTGGGTPEGGGQTPPGSEIKTGEENNQEGQIDFNKGIWQNKDAKDANKEGNKTLTPEELDAKKKSSREFMTNYINELGLTKGIDFSKLASDDESVSVIQEAFNTFGNNVMMAAMQTANQMITNKMQVAIDAAVEKATGSINAGNSFSQMHEKLEYTKNPNVKPIAEQALVSFMNGGQDLPQAITSVDTFMDSMGDHIDKSKNRPPRIRPGNGQFNSPDPSDDEDWVSYISGGTAG